MQCDEHTQIWEKGNSFVNVDGARSSSEKLKREKTCTSVARNAKKFSLRNEFGGDFEAPTLVEKFVPQRNGLLFR